MRPLRPATEDQIIQAENALALMRKARGWLRNADTPQALARLHGVIKSTEGAVRHLKRRAREVSTNGR